MIKGLFKVEFKGKAGSGAGVVTIPGDGTFAGGDSGIYYQGKITEDGLKLRVKLMTRRHTETNQHSVFGNDNVSVDLTGELRQDGGAFKLALPDLDFTVEGSRLANIN